MRRSSARLALAAAGFAAAGLALPASAGVAPAKLVVSDPADDALVGGADDIVKLTWTTTGNHHAARPSAPAPCASSPGTGTMVRNRKARTR